MSVDELVDRAHGLVKEGVTPACQVAVARDGQLLAYETFGAADHDVRFCVFSATKPIVASMIWTLIADGHIDPARRVADYLPEFETHGKHIVTVEQVMLHTAGFPNATMDPLEGADPQRRLARFARWELEWEPGTRFEYHALSAHWVLAQLIEHATGRDFRDALEARVTAPLGLPRLLGIAAEQQGDVVDGIRIGAPPPDETPPDETPPDETPPDETIDLMRFNDSAVRAAGVPGGGGIMTAATMARFYQALLANPGGLWDDAVLTDATSNVRCRFEDPLMRVPANRSLGLVLAGDDGLHQFRYGMFGEGCSPNAFGHAGAHSQVAWADPATGVSFAFVKNGLDVDMFADALRVLPLCDLAAALDR